MLRILTLLLLLAPLVGAPVLAQAPPEQEPVSAAESEAVEEAEEAAEETVAEEEEPDLPDIDVWSEEDQDDDVFVPTESISADASIAFPVDI
jgi:hypothetical protein